MSLSLLSSEPGLRSVRVWVAMSTKIVGGRTRKEDGGSGDQGSGSEAFKALPRSSFLVRGWHPICFYVTSREAARIHGHTFQPLHFLRHHPRGCRGFGVL